MSRYSMAKLDNEYVVQAEGRRILRLSSRRQAAKLITALVDRETGTDFHQRRLYPQPPPQPKPKRGPQ